MIIKNSVEAVELDLMGGIGESWFDESITMNSVKDALNENRDKDLILNISSLGGDVNHAFAIHDLIKMHKGQTTARIIGMTASAGTVVSQGADKVEMSENALFLVHPCWTATRGNAAEHRERAEELDKIDELIANTYKPRTQKRKSQLLSLMAEERWINAEEAKELGFVDKVFKPTSTMNMAVFNAINESKVLPNIKIMDKSIIERIKDMFSFKDDLVEDQLPEQIKAKMDEQTSEIEANKSTISDQAATIAGFEDERQGLITSHQDEVNELTNNLNEAKAKIEVFNVELEKLQSYATELKVEAKEDESLFEAVQNHVNQIMATATDIQGNDPNLSDEPVDNAVYSHVRELPDNIKRKLKKQN